jgi:hypothetical protein
VGKIHQLQDKMFACLSQSTGVQNHEGTRQHTKGDTNGDIGCFERLIGFGLNARQHTSILVFREGRLLVARLQTTRWGYNQQPRGRP